MKCHLMRMLIGTSVLVGGLISDAGAGTAQAQHYGGQGGYQGGYGGQGGYRGRLRRPRWLPGRLRRPRWLPGRLRRLTAATVATAATAATGAATAATAARAATGAATAATADEGAEGATRHAARPGEIRAGRRFLCRRAAAPPGWDAGSLRDRPAAVPVTPPVVA